EDESDRQRRSKDGENDPEQPLQQRQQPVALAEQANRRAKRQSSEHPIEPVLQQQLLDHLDADEVEQASDQPGKEEDDSGESQRRFSTVTTNESAAMATNVAAACRTGARDSSYV